MDVSILPLNEERTEDFLHFFDHIAFKDNKAWSGCYCYYYHTALDDAAFDQRTGADNRLSAVQLIKEGKLTGYLAYCEGEPIGWCNVNDKASYERLAGLEEFWDACPGKICAIVCFVIAPDHRRQGIASQILDRICRDYAKLGYEYVEAYPRKGELTSAQHYHGPMAMYDRAGFTVHKALNGFDIVRRKL